MIFFAYHCTSLHVHAHTSYGLTDNLVLYGRPMYMVQVIARGVYIVIGSEKRGNFAQNTKFYHFSNCHHTKAFRALGFPLALQTL